MKLKAFSITACLITGLLFVNGAFAELSNEELLQYEQKQLSNQLEAVRRAQYEEMQSLIQQQELEWQLMVQEMNAEREHRTQVQKILKQELARLEESNKHREEVERKYREFAEGLRLLRIAHEIDVEKLRLKHREALVLIRNKHRKQIDQQRAKFSEEMRMINQ